MGNPLEYIVFEPDQVLTNNHLINLFNYLDQQERWSRNKLIGIGIACGLDIDQHIDDGSIEITKGCGITSQGYLIILQDTTPYTCCIPYSPIDPPKDLPFTCDPPDLPFYKPFFDNKETVKIWQLLTSEQSKDHQNHR